MLTLIVIINGGYGYSIETLPLPGLKPLQNQGLGASQVDG